jgi:hypothetical protein
MRKYRSASDEPSTTKYALASPLKAKMRLARERDRVSI